jgi:hypothetical protein
MILMLNHQHNLWHECWHELVNSVCQVIKFDLGINSVVSQGTQVISIYSPFWMVNRTGKHLSYRGQGRNSPTVA